MGGGGGREGLQSLGYLCYPVTFAAGFHLFLFLHLSRKNNCDYYYYYNYCKKECLKERLFYYCKILVAFLIVKTIRKLLLVIANQKSDDQTKTLTSMISSKADFRFKLQKELQ